VVVPSLVVAPSNVAFRETLGNHLIEWLRRNPEEVCAILPEWNALIHCLQT